MIYVTYIIYYLDKDYIITCRQEYLIFWCILYLNYCVFVWGNTFDSYLNPLVVLQKRAVRVIAGAKRNSPTEPIFKKLKLLKLKQIYLFAVQLFVFKFYHKIFASLLPRRLPLPKDLNLSKKYSYSQKTDSIFKISFLFQKDPIFIGDWFFFPQL